MIHAFKNITNDWSYDILVYWLPYRLRQFYMDVSNSSANVTTAMQRTRCFTDYTTAPNLPPYITNIPCKYTARYVIVETTYDAPEDEETGAILEICEIEVNGMFLFFSKMNFSQDFV